MIADPTYAHIANACWTTTGYRVGYWLWQIGDQGRMWTTHVNRILEFVPNVPRCPQNVFPPPPSLIV
jgi:hypothetical protein